MIGKDSFGYHIEKMNQSLGDSNVIWFSKSTEDKDAVSPKESPVLCTNILFMASAKVAMIYG